MFTHSAPPGRRASFPGLLMGALLVVGAGLLLWRAFFMTHEEAGLRQGGLGPAPVESAAPMADVSELSSGAAQLETEGPTREPKVVVEQAVETVRVYGDIRATSGEPVGRGRIHLQDGWGRSHSVNFKGGVWALGGLSPGVWHTRVQAPGYRWQELELVIPETNSELRHDWTLVASTVLDICIRTPSGQLIRSFVAGATPVAVATRHAPGRRLPPTLNETHEKFGIGAYESGALGLSNKRFAEGVTGKLELFEPLPAHISLVLRDAVVETQFVPIGTRRVEFELSKAMAQSLSGDLVVTLVRVEDGQPLVGASATLTTQDTSWSTEKSNSSGVLRWDDMESGLMLLEVKAPGRAIVARLIDIRPGEGTQLELRVPSGYSVSGRIVDAEGNPVRVNFQFVPQREHVDTAGYDVLTSGISQSNGSFQVKHVEPGRYWLRPIRGGKNYWPTGIAFDTSRGDVEGLEIQLARGSKVRLEFELSRPWRYGFAIADEDGVFHVGGHVERSGFRVIELSDGIHTLELRDGSKVLKTKQFTVQGQSTTRIAY